MSVQCTLSTPCGARETHAQRLTEARTELKPSFLEIRPYSAPILFLLNYFHSLGSERVVVSRGVASFSSPGTTLHTQVCSLPEFDYICTFIIHHSSFATMEAMQWSEQASAPNDGSTGAPTIKNHSVTHFNGFLYCFGGYDGRRNHLTLLLYSIRESRWIRPHHFEGNSNEQAGLFLGDTSILVTGTPPPGRNGHSATLAKDPEDENETARIIIIGGWLGTGPLAASDMHVLDISNGGRQLRWYQPAVKGTPPGPCNMHSADYVMARKEVYVFRGGNGREYLNDLHALDTTTLTWRTVETTGAIPQQRANHSSSILEETGELFIFGGWYVPDAVFWSIAGSGGAGGWFCLAKRHRNL